MAPKDRAPSSLGFKYPANRDELTKGGDLWLEDKRKDDGAEGYWRIHDELYDLDNFMDRHPGGKMWLELTKQSFLNLSRIDISGNQFLALTNFGDHALHHLFPMLDHGSLQFIYQGTDITEAFEVHHLSAKPQNMLQKFYVGKAKTARNSPFTFKNDGFYRTLKRNVRPTLETIPQTPAFKSNLLADSMLISTLIFCALTCHFWSYTLALVSAIFLTWTTIIGHNYFHRKDNFRMYYFDISLMESREWRISHALSHHLLTNTIQDLEISIAEPILQYLPTPKSKTRIISSWLLAPVIWSSLYHMSFIKRILPALIARDLQRIRSTNVIPFIVPLIMWWFGGQNILATLGMWNLIIFIGSTMFGTIGFNAAHHHPDIFHDGDAVRKDMDWGVAQLDSVMDRTDINGNQFLVLTNFGDHALHHLFPTLDHGSLQFIYPVFRKTCKDFGIDLRLTTQFELIKGQYRQLCRTKPNKNETNLLKYSKKC